MDQDSQREQRQGYPAEKARQGRIVLNTPLRKALFFGGLIAFVLLAVILSILGLRT